MPQPNFVQSPRGAVKQLFCSEEGCLYPESINLTAPHSSSAYSVFTMGVDRKASKREQKAAKFKSQSKGKGKADAGSVRDVPESDLLDENGASNDLEEAESEALGVLSSIKKAKKGKGKRKADGSDAQAHNDTDANASESDPAEPQRAHVEKKKRSKNASDTADAAEPPVVPAQEAAVSRKRKRDAPDAPAGSGNAGTKKTFGDDGQVQAVTAGVQLPDAAATAPAPGKVETKKYIVFVGNMSYKSSQAAISKHFADHCGETPNVRLLTTKADPTALAKLSKSKQKSIAKGRASHEAAGGRSRGCAFVEFSSATALQKALHFHHTFLDGRQINVELTAGGGGNTKGRAEKIKKKNEKLDQERVRKEQLIHDRHR